VCELRSERDVPGTKDKADKGVTVSGIENIRSDYYSYAKSSRRARAVYSLRTIKECHCRMANLSQHLCFPFFFLSLG